MAGREFGGHGKGDASMSIMIFTTNLDPEIGEGREPGGKVNQMKTNGNQ
jgi:hypothetical protein